MKNDSYQRIIERLKQTNPSPESPAQLTDHIMHQIISNSPEKQGYFIIKANEKQWTVYRVIRAITTMAAVFLIGFFVIQQSEINRKLNRLENELTLSNSFHIDYPGRNERIQQVIYEFQQSPAGNITASPQNDMLQINRKSLNYLLEKIRELEKENTSYRVKLMESYSDTTVSKLKIR